MGASAGSEHFKALLLALEATIRESRSSIRAPSNNKPEN